MNIKYVALGILINTICCAFVAAQVTDSVQTPATLKNGLNFLVIGDWEDAGKIFKRRSRNNWR